MAVQYSAAVRNAQLDQFETTAGVSAHLHIRTGAAPVDCATAASGTLLCDMSLPSDWMNNASAGSKTKLGAWSGVGGATPGTAAHFRIVDSAGTTCHMQGTVTATGGGGDMTLDNVSIATAQVVTVSTFTISRGNA